MVDLDLALRDLSRHLDVPVAPGLPARVAHLVTERRSRPLTWRTWMAAVLAFVAPSVLLSDAFADRVGLDRVDVRQAPLPERIGSDLDLGRASTLRQATGAVSFPLSLPSALGPPDEVWLEDEAVTFVWPGPLLLTELRGDVPRPFLGKVLGPANIEEISVGGAHGIWITGPPHVVFHVDEDNRLHEDRSRLAANVLLWSRDGITYRLETTGDRESALRLARNLRRVTGVQGS